MVLGIFLITQLIDIQHGKEPISSGQFESIVSKDSKGSASEVIMTIIRGQLHLQYRNKKQVRLLLGHLINKDHNADYTGRQKLFCLK